MPLTAEELNRLCNEVLSAIEIQEARLLNWGFINGAITLDDLDARLPDLAQRLAADSPELAALWAQAQADGLHSGAIVQNLVDRCLIFPSRNRYRSRFAETVRALFLLRQRFSVDDWSSGDHLNTCPTAASTCWRRITRNTCCNGQDITIGSGW